MSNVAAKIAVACIAVASACAPINHDVRRPLVTDQTPLGMTRADVKAWHLAHGWCVGRTWPSSDEYETCLPYGDAGTSSPPIRSLFHFEGDVMVSAAVYAPVSCGRVCLQVDVHTSNAGPPFVVFDQGLVATPTTAGQSSPLEVEVPADQHRALDAMRVELTARYGEPAWINPTGTAMQWSSSHETIGLFLSADARWTVETHERASSLR